MTNTEAWQPMSVLQKSAIPTPARFLRPRRIFTGVCVTLVFILLVLSLFSLQPSIWSAPLQNPPAQTQPSDDPPTDAFLHLIIPATNSNKYLCRLLLSAATLGYPRPALINWGSVQGNIKADVKANEKGSKEEEDEHAQHLAKVDGLVRYLTSLPSENDQDLALIVDGFDVLLQLRPDVVLKRYHSLIERANRRLADSVGPEMVEAHGLRQSVVFGPDKVCWPRLEGRLACDAVPQSPLPADTFGPYTDIGNWQKRARWLNSGTVMGPVADVRRVFQEALQMIKDNGRVTSDQYYLADLWGGQEHFRSFLTDNLTHHKREVTIPGIDPYDDVPLVPYTASNFNLAERNHELHITLDYESQLFQTVSFYFRYVGWIDYNADPLRGYMETNSDTPSFSLPEDILESPPPFSIFGPERSANFAGSAVGAEARKLTWTNLTLATNVATNHVFPLLHVTQPKRFRDLWWPYMWYYPFAKSIIQSTVLPEQVDPHTTTMDGRVWWNYRAKLSGGLEEEGNATIAFDDKGSWHSWNGICSEHDDDTFA